MAHIDYSARVQTVQREEDPAYYDLIKAFSSLPNCPVIVNASLFTHALLGVTAAKRIQGLLRDESALAKSFVR